jgi:hypothetical protein
MEAYSHLRCRGSRTGHVPQIPSGVPCLGCDSSPRGAVVAAVINVDGVAAGVLSAPVDVLVLAGRPGFSAVGPEERDVRPALHSEVGVALVCDGRIFLQQDLHPALSRREIVDLPPIAERERRDVLRDPEPASSTIAAVLDYQVIGVLKVAVPLDLLDASGRPDFSAVRLDDGDRRLWWLHTISPAGVQAYTPISKSTPNDHFTAGPDCRVQLNARGWL